MFRQKRRTAFEIQIKYKASGQLDIRFKCKEDSEVIEKFASDRRWVKLNLSNFAMDSDTNRILIGEN